MDTMTTLLITDVHLLDPEDGHREEVPGWLLLRDGVIADRGRGAPPDLGAEEATRLPGGGATALPGLIDAHVHLMVTSLRMDEIAQWTPGYTTIRALRAAERMLHRGFTSVRDVGGADRGLARAVEEGLVAGPRIQFAGRMISQTGGHGDMRSLEESSLSCRCEETGIAVIADGADQVRAAAREHLRQGASLVKLAASGGVASPHDDVSAVQYTPEEIRAAVVEADNANSYVTVHAYHPRAIRQAVEAGVRCVEHGNLLDEETAALMADRGTWLVPTLITYELLATRGAEAGLGAESIAKVSDVRDSGLRAYALAARAGIPMAFGTDLLAEMEVAQLQEFTLRAQVAPAAQVLREATSEAARLLGWEGRAGTLRTGAWADLLLVDGNPLTDISVLTDPTSRLRAVIKAGEVVATPAA